MIIDHTRVEYIKKWQWLNQASKYNGAYYYSHEIVENIIPEIQTDRNWITVNVRDVGVDHSIVFIHNNMKPQNYEWLQKYDDIILVCGVESTVDKVSHIGKAIYLPLSIDVNYVKKFKKKTHKGAAFAGRAVKRRMPGIHLPDGIYYIEGVSRDSFLKAMAGYKTIYAVGRTALEALALGCEVGAYDDRYPDVDMWQVMDNKDAAKILQDKLDEIDGTAAAEEAPSMDWTKAQLIDYANGHNIYIDKRDTKAMILSKINA